MGVGGGCLGVDSDKEVSLSLASYIHIMCGVLHIQVDRVA